MRILLMAAALVLSGCSVTATMPAYAPVNNLDLAGSVEVREFDYLLEKKIGSMRLNNTAAGTITVNEPVGEIVQNGVRREFRQAGISTKEGAKCWIDGEIPDLTLDDLGYSVTFRSEIRFRLHGQGGGLLDKSYRREFDGTKGEITPGLIAVNTMIGEIVEQLLMDPDFKAALHQDCGG